MRLCQPSLGVCVLCLQCFTLLKQFSHRANINVARGQGSSLVYQKPNIVYVTIIITFILTVIIHTAAAGLGLIDSTVVC